MSTKILVEHGVEYSFLPHDKFREFEIIEKNLETMKEIRVMIYITNVRDLYLLLAHWNMDKRGLMQYTHEGFSFPPTVSAVKNLQNKNNIT